MLLNLYRSLRSYRGFILGSVKREFQSRYRNSLFGALWTVLNPLSMIVVYTVIFSQIMRARLPGVDDGLAYSVYLCAGLLTWGLFSEITLRSQSMFLENANLLKKISFPRICLPVIVLCNAGINFAIILALFFGFLLISGRLPGMALLHFHSQDPVTWKGRLPFRLEKGAYVLKPELALFLKTAETSHNSSLRSEASNLLRLIGRRIEARVSD